jgi:ABC-type lipoprotein release transport system permease subunit
MPKAAKTWQTSSGSELTMLAIIRFSLQDMLRHYKPWLAMAVLVAATNMIFLGLGGFRNAIQQEFGTLQYDDLVVQESDTVGEFFGSRLSPEVGDRLLALGISRVIPEIHEYTGTSITNITLLRGIDLEQYQQVIFFKILTGRALQPGDTQRSTLIGWRLADRFSILPGQSITLRGRQFLVTGIFQTGTYVDNEAWIPLDAAQDLLGFGKDVSIYIIPDEGILKAGDTLPGGVAIVERGLGPQTSSNQFEPLFKIIELIYHTLGIAVILTLANALFRIAWIHRRELAILRCVGFQPRALVVYLLSQALIMNWAGVILGTLSTALLFSFLSTDLVGMTLHPSISLQTGLAGLGQSAGIAVFGTIIPAWWFNRLSLANQLRSE